LAAGSWRPKLVVITQSNAQWTHEPRASSQ
jgi:hypothetical protein